MKLLSKLILSFSVFCMLACLQAQGQTYYNFALGGLSSPYNPTHAIIRTIDAQRAVAYYGGPGVATSVLAYIDLSTLTVSRLELDGGFDQLKDIRIENGVVFFCGRNSQTLRGFIGHVTLADLIASTANSIHCYDIYDPGLMAYTSSTIMWRLAAYNDGTGTTRVVCLGNTWFQNGNTTFYPCTDTVYPTCQASFIVECTYSGTLSTPMNMIVVSDATRFELADDVVVTDNWLAIISRFPAQDEIVIHRCAKNDVINTFNNFYSFKVNSLEGVNHCCHMKGDTIADATLYSSPSVSHYESHLRVFDLNTMTMTRAQQFDLLEKAEPQEVVYLPDYATLVTLQYQMYPSNVLHHTFVSWKPYSTTPYFAKLTYEIITNKKFESLDKLTQKHIVAAGGDYWLMKDIINDDPSTTCYKLAQQKVEALQLSPGIESNYIYDTFTLPPTTFQQGLYLPALPLQGGCITP